MARITKRFRYGPGAVALLKELLKLDWKKRINAIDALEHPYLHSAPLPAKPGDLPIMEESHEYDRRKFHDRKAALPPAPKGGTVGRGPQQGAGGPDAGFNSGDGFGGRNGMSSGRYPAPPRNGPGPGERVPAWSRGGPHGLPPRPPPPESYVDRDRDRPPRTRPAVAPSGRNDVDTYIPPYQRDRVDRYEQDRRRRTRSRSPGRRLPERDHRDRR